MSFATGQEVFVIRNMCGNTASLFQVNVVSAGKGKVFLHYTDFFMLPEKDVYKTKLEALRNIPLNSGTIFVDHTSTALSPVEAMALSGDQKILETMRRTV